MTREEASKILQRLKMLSETESGEIAIDMAISALENNREWIPVSSGKLPKIGQRVLVTIETYDDGRTVRETIYDKYGFLCGNGIAWQPLPETYKGESEE